MLALPVNPDASAYEVDVRPTTLDDFRAPQPHALHETAGELTERYTESIDRGETDIELDASSLRLYLERTDLLSRLTAIGEAAGMTRDDDLELSPDPEEIGQLLWALSEPFIFTIAQLEEFAPGIEDWAEGPLEKLVAYSAEEGFVPYAIGQHILA